MIRGHRRRRWKNTTSVLHSRRGFGSERRGSQPPLHSRRASCPDKAVSLHRHCLPRAWLFQPARRRPPPLEDATAAHRKGLQTELDILATRNGRVGPRGYRCGASGLEKELVGRKREARGAGGAFPERRRWRSKRSSSCASNCAPPPPRPCLRPTPMARSRRRQTGCRPARGTAPQPSSALQRRPKPNWQDPPGARLPLILPSGRRTGRRLRRRRTGPASPSGAHGQATRSDAILHLADEPGEKRVIGQRPRARRRWPGASRPAARRSRQSESNPSVYSCSAGTSGRRQDGNRPRAGGNALRRRAATSSPST